MTAQTYPKIGFKAVENACMPAVGQITIQMTETSPVVTVDLSARQVISWCAIMMRELARRGAMTDWRDFIPEQGGEKQEAAE